jgi:hypothetical protein
LTGVARQVVVVSGQFHTPLPIRCFVDTRDWLSL